MASKTIIRPIFVVVGVGAGGGTGAATARAFSKAGYSVALVARNEDSVKKLAEEINKSGGDALPLPVPSYTPTAFASVFSKLRAIPKELSPKYPDAKYEVRAALYNAGGGVFKPFLSITSEEVSEIVGANTAAAFAFAREAILAFKENELSVPAVDESGGANRVLVDGKRGFLAFTGATASVKAGPISSAFAASKFAIRALSQSLAKEFGKENIHVAHAVIDGGILTDRLRERLQNPEREQTADAQLTPEGIAQAYLYLANQERSTWTWELDLRPAHEKW